MIRTEHLTLHFDLSHCPRDVVFTLSAGGGRHYILRRYDEAPGKLAEHRRANRALGLLPDAQLRRITHFIENAEFDSEALSMRSVVYPSRLPGAPLPELALVFIHIPREHRRRALRQLRGRGVSLPPDKILQHYGVVPEAVAGEMEIDVRLDAAHILPPLAAAQAIVFHHPEIGTTNTVVAEQVFQQHIRYTQAFRDLTEYVSDHGPETGNGWYQQTYATWVNPDTGLEEPAEANDNLVDATGNKVSWPQLKGKPAIPQYELSDEFNSPDSGVMGAATAVIHEVLRAVEDDDSLNGHLWTRQNGMTEQRLTNVDPVSGARRAPSSSVRDASRGWTVRNKTSSYGLEVYPDQLAFSPQDNTLTLPVKNWLNRYLGAYVRFLREDGTPILRCDIPLWQDPFGDNEGLIRNFEPDMTKSLVAWLSSGNQVFGVPFPTQPVDLQFVWPQEATKAELLFGGLGVAAGFRDLDLSLASAGSHGPA